MSGGIRLPLIVTYYARPCKERGKTGGGVYPALFRLGIFDKCSPGLASDVSQAAAALCSLREAQDMLAARGCLLDVKTIRNIVKRFAARARLSQEDGGFCDEILDTGCRVAISMDGGRVRIRKNKKGPKTKLKRTRYHTDWREPKLFIIYVADKNGRMSKTARPVMDASLNGPDSIFSLLAFYAEQMDLRKASEVVFVADGALWIWERARKLLAKLGLKVKQIHLVLDYYHAVEHLSHLLELKKFPEADRKSLLKKYRKLLLQGDIDEVCQFVESLAKHAKSKAKMLYARIAALQLPIGSGAVESAIRRVINLRLKGPGIFWHEDSANEMLMLRCYYKAGRWGLLKQMAFEPPLETAA